MSKTNQYAPWIKIEHALLDKPEVFRIAKLCGLSRYETLGALLALFVWYDKQLDNPGGAVTHEVINGIVGIEEFSTALCTVGWLRERGDELVVVNLEKHNGRTAKQRAVDARRNRGNYWAVRERLRSLTGETSGSSPVHIEKEKEQSQSQKQKQAAPPTLPDWIPADAWAGFLEMRVKKHRPMTSAAMKLAIAKLEKLRAHGHDVRAVLEQSTLGSWTGLYEIKPDAAGKPLSPHTGFDKRDYAKGATNLDEIDWANDGKRND